METTLDSDNRPHRLADAVAAIRSHAAGLIDAGYTPGLQIALTDRDGLVAQIELGVANIDSHAPVGRDTLFQFGSIGKTFTAICLLQLVEEGRIDLHGPIETYLPWFSVRTDFEPITAHHLLTNTAGIICGTEFTPSHLFEAWSLRHTGTKFEPGSQFHYSNDGYKVLGFALEYLEGKPYEQIVRERVLDPLGMTNSVAVTTAELRPRLAIGYMPEFDDRPVLRRHGFVPGTWFDTNSGDGCICASASDLAVFLRMLLNRGAYPGGQLISEKSYRLMTTPLITFEEGSDFGYGYGYGLVVPIDQSSGKFEHGGGMVGFISTMDGDRDTGFGAVVFTNSMYEVGPIGPYALRALASAAGGESIPAPKQPEIAPLSDYAGTYVGSGEVVFAIEGEDLVMTRDGTSSALTTVPDSTDRFVHDLPGEQLFPYRFERDDAGAVTGVVHGERVWNRGNNAEPDTELPADYAAYPGHYRLHNPWGVNFRVVIRAGKLLMIAPDGSEDQLIAEGDHFRASSSEGLPETLKFDTIVDGQALQARDELGSLFHRVFTP